MAREGVIAIARRRKKWRSPIPNADAVRLILRLLSSDLRCNMAIRLAAEPMDASALAARLRCAPSTASRNLRRLVEGRIVEVDRLQGKHVYRLSNIVSVQRSGDMVELHVGIPCGGEVALRLFRPIDRP